MRAGLLFTSVQHETIARLVWDIAQRHGWPRHEPWWRSTRLLGHEDITPLSRSLPDRNGGWDPGALREKPYWDWNVVCAYLERLQGGNIATAGFRLYRQPLIIVQQVARDIHRVFSPVNPCKSRKSGSR
jgi:hypothetical protein